MEAIRVAPLPTVRMSPGPADPVVPGANAQPAPAEPDSNSALAAARQAVTDAELALAEAEVIRDDDWQTLVTGGRVLAHRYFLRITEAEDHLNAARGELARLTRRR